MPKTITHFYRCSISHAIAVPGSLVWRSLTITIPKNNPFPLQLIHTMSNV